MKKNSVRKKWIIGIVIVVVIGIAVGGWFYYQSLTPQPVAPPALKTAKVRTGDIIITAEGTGSLIPAREVNLGFKSGGRVVEITVAAGDHVEEGQTLIRLDDTDVKMQIAQAEISLRIAELKVTEIQRDPEASAIAIARDTITSAQSALESLEAGPTAQDITIAKADLELAAISLQAAQAAYDRISYQPGASASKEAMSLWQTTLAYDKAKATYEQRLSGADASLITAARAKVSSAQAQLETLLLGASAEDIESAQLAVQQARNNLTTASAQLENIVMKATFAGTITALKASVGELVGTASIVSLIATTPILIRFYIEEGDLENVDVGDPVAIAFNARPDDRLAGVVSSISPIMSLVNGIPAAEMVAQVEADSQSASWLRVGMSADVEVTADSAKAALLVPLDAVREIAPGSYAVFVVKADGSLEMRPVDVGLSDFANIEIKSGLKNGEVVSTGTVETQ